MKSVLSGVSALAGGLFAVAAGFSLAVVVNSYLEYKLFTLPPAKIEQKKVDISRKTADYRYISYIIGGVDKKTVTTDRQTGLQEVAHDEKEGFELLGTMKVDKRNIALIKTGNKLKLVKEGDVIDGLKVEKIGKFHIEGTRNGKKYRINISLKKTTGELKTAVNKTYTSHSDTIPSRQVVKLEKRFVEEKTADIGKLMKDVFIQPVVRNGETIGFMFRYIKPNSLLYKLGLRSGDMIVSVNGRSIKTVEEAFKIYNILRNESTVEVVIKRRGKEKTLVFEIQ